MAVYKILVSKSVGIYYDVEAIAKMKLLICLTTVRIVVRATGEYDVDSFVVEAKKEGVTDDN